MATYYIDWKDGNDSNDGTTFANRKKSFNSLKNTQTLSGGDEVRFAGVPATILDTNAKIWNWYPDHARQSRSPGSITYSQTTGETTLNLNNHGMQTGDTIGIEQNTNFTNAWETINGVWEVTRVDANNYKLNGYTAPSGATTGSGGYFRYLKAQTIQLSSPVTETIASTGQRTAWTASSNVTASLETFTATWSSGCTWREHYYSDKITIADGFGTGKAAYWPTGALDLSGYQQVSFLCGQKSGTRSAPGSPNVSLRLCTDSSGDTSVHTIPVYTGEDSDTSNGLWRTITKDLATNLNSSINSIALYVDTDSGAQEFLFNNIIACKAKSAADSLTLNSIVGLGTQIQCPMYYRINSIVGKRVLLQGPDTYYSYYPYAYYAPSGVHWEGVGVARTTQSQTQTIYKIEPWQIREDLGVGPKSNNAYYDLTYIHNSSNQCGLSTTNRMTVSGGWDATNTGQMATQYNTYASGSTIPAMGYSAVSGQNARGYVLNFEYCYYMKFSRFIGVGGYYGVRTQYNYYCQFNDIGGIGGYYGMGFEYNYKLLGGCNLWGTVGNSGLYAAWNNDWNDYEEQNAGLTTMRGSTGQSHGCNFQYNYDCNVYQLEGYVSSSSQPLNAYYMQNGGNRFDRMFGSDQGWGSGSSYGIRIGSNESGFSVGVATSLNCYYGMYCSDSLDWSIDTLDVKQEDWNQANGSYGNKVVQYSLYTGQQANCLVRGGTWCARPYVQQSDMKLENVVFDFTDNPQFQQYDAKVLCKNFDGVAGAYKNYFRYGSVEPETSIRHTSSGVSWKIDISTSSASPTTPLTWELSKVVCNANAQVTVSIWVYRDGTGVNGGIRVKANAIAGVSSNVDAVISDTTINSWVQCTLTFTPTEAGAVSVWAIAYQSPSGGNNSHNVYLDDFSVSQA